MATKILIVDDSSTYRLIIKNMLCEYDILTACNGEEALSIINDNLDIDLIILDLNMPKVDGFQVLHELRSNVKYMKMRTIILSNYDEIDNEIKGLQLGAVDYIRKPINMETLIIRIKIHIQLLNAQQMIEEERNFIEEALLESERSKAVLISNLPGMAYRCDYDREWTMKFVSDGCYELTGYKAESLINNKKLSFNDLISPKYRQLLWNEWQRTLSNKLSFKYEYEIITASGQKKWVLEMGQGIWDEHDNIEALEGIIIDISDRKEHENKLKYISEHDELTGFFNHRWFEELLERESIKVNKSKRAILMINLKKINSISLTYGYNFSQKLIKEFAVKLFKLQDSNKVLFKVSYEKIGLYINNYDSQNELSDCCIEVFDIIKEVQILNNLGCSIGILEIEKDDWDAESILKNVSVAAEFSDDKKIYSYCFYDDELKAKVTRENLIKYELLKTIQNGNNENIYLEYQPILDLKTNEISGYEALARFKTEKLGVVQPVEFVPIAEEMQLIVPIGLRVMELAFKFAKRMEAEGYNNLKISVNVSIIQLLRDEFVDDLTKLINEAGINASNIGIELTESIFSDNYQTINDKLGKLKEMGIEVAIDDFGTGYSSLSRERELNVKCLKLDKYFIDKILMQDMEQSITGDIISMAHKLGHVVVAEGVEHEVQKQYLRKNNCDFIQGYLFSRPLIQEEALKFLKYKQLP